MRHGGAGVAGGGGQNGHRLIAGHFRQHLRHKAAAEVFERQRRAVEQLGQETSSVTFATGAGNSKAACTRFFSAASGTSSPIKADRMRLLRVTKSCSGSWSISVSSNSGNSSGKNSPAACRALLDRLREADLLVVILKVVQFHALSQ